MRSRSFPKARPAFTLLEMILAATIAVLLLGALYVAVDLQLRHASAARDVVERTTLARTLLKQVANDIAPDLATADPTRYQQGGQSGSGGSGGSSGTTGAASSTAASSSSSSASTAAGSASATSGNNIANSSSTFSATSGTMATSSPNGLAVLALQGTTNTLTLYVSRVPPYSNNPADNQSQPTVLSDQRRIAYWLADGVGLARQEVVATTSEDALNQNVPSGAPDQYTKVLAKEVTSLEFQYFDGSEWQDSWDGTQVGADGVTPIGPPLAVAITIALRQPGTDDVKQYRHVVAIPTANGTTSAQQQSSTAGSGSGSSSGGNSSGP